MNERGSYGERGVGGAECWGAAADTASSDTALRGGVWRRTGRRCEDSSGCGAASGAVPTLMRTPSVATGAATRGGDAGGRGAGDSCGAVPLELSAPGLPGATSA